MNFPAFPTLCNRQSLCPPLVALVTRFFPRSFREHIPRIVEDVTELQSSDVLAFHEVREGKTETLVGGITCSEHFRVFVCSCIACVG